MTARVTELRAVEAGVVHMEEATRFYTAVWGLTQVAEEDGARFFRGTGPMHHILALRQAARPSMVRIVLGAPDSDSVEALYGAVKAAGAGKVEPPKALQRPGGGYGFGFQDPEKRNFAIVAGVEDHAESGDAPDRPRKLGHVNINAGDSDATFSYLTEVLGFELSDETRTLRFLRCDSQHSAIVLGFSGGPTLNHVAYEMADLDSVMRGIGRMRDEGYPVEWGPGRHGPGDNVFAYFCGPEEFPIEYTAETLQVGDDHQPKGPDHWKWPPGRLDRWGVTGPPTPRFQR
ncbi:MAG TPA: VOC family protein, partial [Afifellaceae bacterium]|nr:VOC family protein [Afifellaceae bacterium]